MTLALDPSLPDVYRWARECVAAGVYKRGLGKIASDLDVSPGNLSVALSDDPTRKFGLDEAEKYTRVTGDKTWIYYLVAKYLGDECAMRDHALTEVHQMLSALPGKLAAAGVGAPGKRGGR
jgi:hypothetical protein